MSDPVVTPDLAHSETPSRRGQTLVEFALTLPMLLVLLLGVADFGRVFASGITTEALARNAAEAASQEYLQVRRATTGPPDPA
ncbi:MAG TPA: TadE/TadG family type IV pilus assembly protein, partial [Candidatus Limnocylindria bacterium]|nr:TadE/TadG family type IV pilus assembly protein [Candidatus Limnocylindria bacterium]